MTEEGNVCPGMSSYFAFAGVRGGTGRKVRRIEPARLTRAALIFIGDLVHRWPSASSFKHPSYGRAGGGLRNTMFFFSPTTPEPSFFGGARTTSLFLLKLSHENVFFSSCAGCRNGSWHNFSNSTRSHFTAWSVQMCPNSTQNPISQGFDEISSQTLILYLSSHPYIMNTRDAFQYFCEMDWENNKNGIKIYSCRNGGIHNQNVRCMSWCCSDLRLFHNCVVKYSSLKCAWPFQTFCYWWRDQTFTVRNNMKTD